MTRKPPVQLTQRRDWFQRYEDGESVLRIAKTDGFDPRTVKKQIEVERQERERKEARSLVLRHAMEQHYADLCSFAQKLDLELSSERGTLSTLKEDRMWSALREHLPRSVIWRSLVRLEELRREKSRLEQSLNKFVEKQIESKVQKKFRKSPQEIGLGWRNAEALSVHIRDAALGQSETLPNFDFHKISENKESDTIKMVKEILRKAPNWKKFDDLSRLWAELERIQRVLHDEFAIIILRRVVPGRCRYCPI